MDLESQQTIKKLKKFFLISRPIIAQKKAKKDSFVLHDRKFKFCQWTMIIALLY